MSIKNIFSLGQKNYSLFKSINYTSRCYFSGRNNNPDKEDIGFEENDRLADEIRR